MRHQHIRGFSLIQISILLAASAIVLASILPGKDAGDFNQKTAINIAKLDKVENAMNMFMTLYGRRPCPADGQYDVDVHNFGIEAVNAGSCVDGNGTPDNPAAPLGPDTTGFVVSGTIPTKTLGLPDDYAYDAWGRRFTYVVDKRATLPATCFAMENTGTTGGIIINIKNTSGTIIETDNVMYTYISHGEDGHGAWPSQGSSVPNRINRYINDADSLSNASEMTNFSLNFTNTRFKKDRTTGFDDLVYFHKDDMNVCCIGNGCDIAVFGTTSALNNGAGGFVAQGGAGQAAGTAVAMGDINGDGIDDLIIGAPGASGNKGAVYVIYGTRAIFSSSFSLTSLTGANGGFIINGATGGDKLGSSVAVGDINGDGIKDIIIGAPGYSTLLGNAGAVYVIFGKTAAFANNYALTAPDGTNYIRIDGVAASDMAGTAIASGDINGDGYQDVIIGAPAAAGGNGAAYAVFGKASWAATHTLGLSTLDGIIGFKMTGSNLEGAGTSLATGDINGDGIADIIVGAPNWGAGNVYVVFGGPISQGSGADWLKSGLSSMPLSGLLGTTVNNGTNGFIANGITSGDLTGASVAAGDINGDSIADLIIGAPNTTVAGNAHSGSTYVVFGQNTAWSSPISLAYPALGVSPAAYTTAGFAWYGASGFRTGNVVASGCDINGDGIAEILTGAPLENSAAGDAYVILGAPSGWLSTKYLSTLYGTNGFNTSGQVANDNTGAALAAGDINGVGKCAVVIGAPGATVSGNANSGAVYVILGRPAWGQTFQLNTLR